MLRAPDIEFLSRPRLGMFSTAVGEGWSRPVPVWFSWEQDAIELFSGATSPKVARLRAEPRAHVLAANNMGEQEAWLSIAGSVELHAVDPTWLETVSARYWDLSQDHARRAVDEWLAAIDSMIGITLRPHEVRRFGL